MGPLVFVLASFVDPDLLPLGASMRFGSERFAAPVVAVVDESHVVACRHNKLVLVRKDGFERVLLPDATTLGSKAVYDAPQGCDSVLVDDNGTIRTAMRVYDDESRNAGHSIAVAIRGDAVLVMELARQYSEWEASEGGYRGVDRESGDHICINKDGGGRRKCAAHSFIAPDGWQVTMDPRVTLRKGARTIRRDSQNAIRVGNSIGVIVGQTQLDDGKYGLELWRNGKRTRTVLLEHAGAGHAWSAAASAVSDGRNSYRLSDGKLIWQAPPNPDGWALSPSGLVAVGWLAAEQELLVFRGRDLVARLPAQPPNDGCMGIERAAFASESVLVLHRCGQTTWAIDINGGQRQDNIGNGFSWPKVDDSRLSEGFGSLLVYEQKLRSP